MKSKNQKIVISFKKAQSSINNLIEMLNNEEYCIDIMQQNLAVIGLLKSAHQNLMENHLDTCFSRATKTNNKKLQKQMFDEIKKISKYASKFSCNWSLRN